jgi:ATP-dependent helicase/DNAse subunit B
MIVINLSPSAYKCHDTCEQQYFIQYTLGWRTPSGLAAEKGTIVHKVLELFAKAKLHSQDYLGLVIDPDFGTIDLNTDPDELTQKVFESYKGKSHNAFGVKDLKECLKWTHQALNFNNGAFDPRKQKIVKPELFFDYTLPQDWANYKFSIPPDIHIEGQFALRGVIDLVTEVSDGVHEIIDYKTGSRKDWATGELKTHENLHEDIQLRLYHYAAHKVLGLKNILVTIFYIKDGGPFTISFGEEDLESTEELLKKKFDHIRKTHSPKLNKTWKCRFCAFSKTTFENTHVKPEVEFRDGQFTKAGETMTMCQQANYYNNKYGLTYTTKQLANLTNKVVYGSKDQK